MATEKSPIVQVVEKGWAQIDAEVDRITNVANALQTEGDIDGSTTRDLEALKASARGKAEILAVAMNVGYPKAWRACTANDISNEAGRRAYYRSRGQGYGTIGVESSTRWLDGATAPGWELLEDRRGIVQIDGGA